MALVNQRYHRNFLHYCQKPTQRGIIYHPNIDMTRLEKPKITATIMGKIVEGRTSFYLPYLLNEISNDFIMRRHQVELSPENADIFKWIYAQKINYELKPMYNWIQYRNDEIAILKAADSNEFVTPREELLQEFKIWITNLKDKEPDIYRERFSIDEKGTNVVKYWKASVMLHLTADSIIDESHLDKI